MGTSQSLPQTAIPDRVDPPISASFSRVVSVTRLPVASGIYSTSFGRRATSGEDA